MDQIIRDIAASYGIAIGHVEPITGGWLNEKWKASSDHGDLLVKRFSAQRYPANRLEAVSRALTWQIIVREQGVPCPDIFLCNNDPIRRLDDETAYMVMTFCPGSLQTPLSITIEQMRALGEACGHMHCAFKSIPLDDVPFDPGVTLRQLREHHDRCASALSADDPEGYSQALILQKSILDRLTDEFYARQLKGLAHRDFAIDNILFRGDEVSAIVDFDTGYHSYPRRDIGRALLSFALNDQSLIKERVHAFKEGYAKHESLTFSDMADAMRLVWCLEVSTWIHPRFFIESREKVVRFKDEMLWLSQNWDGLETLMRG